MRLLGKLILTICGLSIAAHAEYRMFTLKITNTETQEYRLVDSTLDPIQYPFYHPVAKGEIVQYTTTWRCYGNTGGGRPPCPNPNIPPEDAPVQATPAQGVPAQNQSPAVNANP